MKPLLYIAGAIALFLIVRGGYAHYSASVRKDQMMKDKATATVLEKATFGAGCFWGVEATFRALPGVVSSAVGYCGGKSENPTYEQVCSDRTGHAEAVQVEFDPTKIGYDALLDVFWKNHDPTQRDRQGPDVGSQYRSVIFYHSPTQKASAEASRAKLEAGGKPGRPIATQIVPAPTFWKAEEYHQQYYEKNGLRSCKL